MCVCVCYYKQGAAALAAYEEALAKEAQARKALEDATNATTPGSADPGADATTETDADTSSVRDIYNTYTAHTCVQPHRCRQRHYNR